MLAIYAAYIAEGIATLIIAFGAFKAFWTHIRDFLSRRSIPGKTCMCRIQLGHSLSLGLEFLVGADVLKTAVAPTWNDIGQLAAIIAIRTVVNFLLMWELEKMEGKGPDAMIPSDG